MRPQQEVEEVVEHQREPFGWTVAAYIRGLRFARAWRRVDRFQNFFHLHAARAFQQQQVAGLDEVREEFSGVFGICEKFRVRSCGWPAATAAFDEFVGVAVHADDPVDFVECRDDAPALAVQFRRRLRPARAFPRRENPARDSRAWRRAGRPARSAPWGSSCRCR